MTQTGSPVQGDVYNWHQISDVTVGKIASSVNIASGTFVYQDGSNGIKTVPTSSIPEAPRIRFCPTGYDNTSGAAGARELETIKTGAIVVAKCTGAITVGNLVQPSTATAGRCMRLYATGAVDFVKPIGRYLGHVGEIESTKNEPSNAATGDLVVIQMI